MALVIGSEHTASELIYQPEICKVDPKVIVMSLMFCLTLNINSLLPLT